MPLAAQGVSPLDIPYLVHHESRVEKEYLLRPSYYVSFICHTHLYADTESSGRPAAPCQDVYGPPVAPPRPRLRRPQTPRVPDTAVTSSGSAAAAEDTAVPKARHKVAGRASTWPRGGTARPARCALAAVTFCRLNHQQNPICSPMCPMHLGAAARGWRGVGRPRPGRGSRTRRTRRREGGQYFREEGMSI